MSYLASVRAWRDAAATLWLMVLGAGLLATSDVETGAPDPLVPLWSGPGPALTLSDAQPVSAFAVTLHVPKGVDGFSLPEFAAVSLNVSAEDGDSGGVGGAGGGAGAAGAPGGETPWLNVTIRDASEGTLLESTSFLNAWTGATSVEFSGDCEVPDPAGPNPCKLSFTVEFERSWAGTEVESEISWLVALFADVSSAKPGVELGWTTEITPL